MIIMWLGDSHARRTFNAVPENTPITVAYAWLAIQMGWEEVLDDIVAQVTNCGAAPRVFLSIGTRTICVSKMDHNQVTCYILEIMKRWVSQGVSLTIMELPFGGDRRGHEEVWRTTCMVRGLNTHILESSPAAALMMQTVTTRGDQSAPLGLGNNFPMYRDVAKFADRVHLRDPYYQEIAEETVKEMDANGLCEPKAPWIVENGQVVHLNAPPGLEASWEDFLQGRRLASEVQVWNPEELFQTPPENRRYQQTLEDWTLWEDNASRGGRTRGARRGYRGRGHYRGRGYGSGGRRPSWHGSSADRRHKEAKNYIFH